MKRVLFAGALVCVCGGLVLASTGYSALLCKPADCPGCPTATWAVPTMLPSPSIVSDKKLLEATGAVAVLKFDPVSDHLFKWTGPPTNTCADVTMTGMLGAGTPAPGGDGQGSCTDGTGAGCFCIDPTQADGYFVIKNAPVAFQIVGDPSGSLPKTLYAQTPGVSVDGVNLWASPALAVNTASELMTSIGFANVQNVQKYIAATDGLQVYTGRKGTPGADFDLEAGVGYFIKMNTTTNYAPGVVLVQGFCPSSLRGFGVVGDADRSVYAWEVKTNLGASLCHNYTAPLTVGFTSSQIAGAIAGDILATCDPAKVTAFADTSSSFFNVTALGTTPKPVQVFLGLSPNAPTCQVTPATSCAFNPVVYDAGAVISTPSVPAMTTWALIHLVLLLMATALVVLGSREMAAEGPVLRWPALGHVVEPRLLARSAAVTGSIAVLALGLTQWWISGPLPANDWIGGTITGLLAGYVWHLWRLYRAPSRS